MVFPLQLGRDHQTEDGWKELFWSQVKVLLSKLYLSQNIKVLELKSS